MYRLRCLPEQRRESLTRYDSTRAKRENLHSIDSEVDVRRILVHAVADAAIKRNAGRAFVLVGSDGRRRHRIDADIVDAHVLLEHLPVRDVGEKAPDVGRSALPNRRELIHEHGLGVAAFLVPASLSSPRTRISRPDRSPSCRPDPAARARWSATRRRTRAARDAAARTGEQNSNGRHTAMARRVRIAICMVGHIGSPERSARASLRR